MKGYTAFLIGLVEAFDTYGTWSVNSDCYTPTASRRPPRTSSRCSAHHQLAPHRRGAPRSPGNQSHAVAWRARRYRCWSPPRRRRPSGCVLWRSSEQLQLEQTPFYLTYLPLGRGVGRNLLFGIGGPICSSTVRIASLSWRFSGRDALEKSLIRRPATLARATSARVMRVRLNVQQQASLLHAIRSRSPAAHLVPAMWSRDRELPASVPRGPLPQGDLATPPQSVLREMSAQVQHRLEPVARPVTRTRPPARPA